MNPPIVRAAAPEDIAAIARIYAEAVIHGTASFELDPPDEAEMARRQETLLAGGYPYLVAEYEGVLAGYAYAGPYRARPAYKWCVEDSIYLEPQFHRRGIGKRLLAELIDASEQRGYRQMVAVIGDSAQAASIALHAACGFVMVGTLRAVGFKFGRWLDTPLMQRALNAGDSTPP